jgi:nicotinamidase-related amidase
MSPPALLVIDLQRDFFDERSGVGHIEKAIGIPAVRKILTFARRSGWIVFHVVTIHSGAESLPLRLRQNGTTPYCVKGTDGSEIVQGLRLGGEHVVIKQRYSAFDNTELTDLLQGISSVVLVGVAADCCILHTASDAMGQNKNVYVPYQAIGASGSGEYAYGLASLAKSIGSIIDAKDLLRKGIPSPELPGPVSEARNLLLNWYQRRIEIAHQEPALQGLPVDAAIQALEDRLAAICLES